MNKYTDIQINWISFQFYKFSLSQVPIKPNFNVIYIGNKTCVCETRMPPVATKLKYGKNLYVLHFDPAPPPGACDVSEVWGTHRWTYSPSLVTVSSSKL